MFHLRESEAMIILAKFEEFETLEVKDTYVTSHTFLPRSERSRVTVTLNQMWT